MQSVLAGMGMSVAAMAAAAAGLLPAVWGALLQEAIDVAVILNALRVLIPATPQPRLTAADAALNIRFAQEDESYLALGDTHGEDATAWAAAPGTSAPGEGTSGPASLVGMARC